MTQDDSDDIERIQKITCKIVLQERYGGYREACENLQLVTLAQRRTDLCLKFGIKCLSSEKHTDLFPLSDQNDHELRHERKPFKEPVTRTERYKKSSIPYISKLLNDHFRPDLI